MASSGSRSSGGSAPCALGAVLRLTGLGYLLGVAAFGVLLDDASRGGVRFGGVAIIVSLGCSRRGRRCPRPSAPGELPARPSESAGHRTVARRGGGRRAGGALPRGAVSRGAPAKPPGVRRLGVLGSEGQGDLLLQRSRRARLHDGAQLDVPAAAADPRRDGFPCDGRGGRHHAARAVLVPPRRRRRRCGRLAASPRPRVADLAPSCSSLVVPRFGERLLEPLADVLLDILVVVAALLLALWLRDRRAGASLLRRSCSPAQ